ncbi:MAG: DUF2892 domain-containing protein [Candidatus Gracilibacteria bacterium]|jgi:hypothetical protein
MQKNEGTVDRIIRAIIALALISAGYFYLTGVLAIIAFVVGAIMFVTVLTGYCALYQLLGISTIKKGK